MAERQEDAAGKDAKKKKAKRKEGTGTRSKEPSGMGSSGRVSSSRQGRDSSTAAAAAAAADDDADEPRRRSKSADKKARRDSGGRRSSGSAPGKGGMSGSSQKQGSPLRVRKTKSSDGAEHRKSPSKGGRTSITADMMRDRSRSRSPTRDRAGGISPPKLPQRTVSESSNLQSNLQALGGRGRGNDRAKPDNFEEASMGDFKKYNSANQNKQQQQQQQQQNMRNIPEESLGSFIAFHQKYEEEALLGLHDDDEIEAPYGPDKKPKQQLKKEQKQTQNDQSASLGALMNPMNKYGGLGEKTAANIPVEASMGSFSSYTKKSPNPQLQNEQSANLGALMNPMSQYGGGRGGKPSAAVDASLGSFTAFNQKYETDKLLGLDGSTMNAFESASPLTKETGSRIAEESMGDFVHIASKEAEAEHHSKHKTKKGDLDSEEKEKELGAVRLPLSRIKNLGKRGGVGYTIMVDTPGGHFQTPMKIVVAIEFDDETDSEDERNDEKDDDENDNPVEQAEDDDEQQGLGQQPQKSFEQANDIDDSGHLPMSPLEEDDIDVSAGLRDRVARREKKQQSRLSGDAKDGKSARLKDESDDHHSDEETDEVAPLASGINRWHHRATTTGGNTLRQPEREKSSHSSSTHSTVSSVTLGSMFGGEGVSIEADNCASNANVLQRRPVGRSAPSRTGASLKRSSGAVRAGGTASLLAKSLNPHNLGTRRGLMLRQQSEASMRSTGTSKSNDSSWAGNNEVPEGYEASFMQLNLMDLDKTQIQTNDEVQKTELPEELLSGVEGLARGGSNEDGKTPGEEEPETIGEGKDPQVAATELLGMKTMLKHIKKVAPKRSKSFEFDRDMGKQMWNKMFAKSQKGALPGSQYVDNDDSTSGNEEEGDDEKMQSTRVEESEQQKAASSTDDKGEGGDAPTTTRVTGGLFSTIKRVAGSTPVTSSNPTEKSATKPKTSFFSSAMKTFIPSSTKGAAIEETEQEQADGKDDEKDAADADASEGSLELDGAMDELNGSMMSLEYEPDEHGTPSTTRRKPRSGRGPRTAPPKKGGTARSRAARAQHVHNRSLRDTLDFLSTEKDDEDLPKLDAVNEEEEKMKPRPRARRKPPVRTKSDDTNGPGRAPPARTKSSDGTKGALGRTRSHDGGSPIRTREAARKMHQSFSGVDPSDLPVKTKPTRATPARAKSRDGGVGVHKGARVAGGKKRPGRKSVTETEEPQPVINLGLKIPENASENEVRELLDYH